MFGPLVTTLLVTAMCLGQRPASQDPAARPAAVDASARRVAVQPWDDKVAKAAVDTLNKSLKGDPNLTQRSAALEPLAAGANTLLVKPLVRIVETDKAVVVQKRAVELLANQPPAAANPALRGLLGHKRVVNVPAVQAAIVHGLSRCGYVRAQWQHIDALFEKSFDASCVPLQEAVLELVATHQEREALPLLLRHLDEPVPHDVDAAHNPPAEYWKARWTAWAVWRDKVKDALFAITGQRFSTAAEAQAWLDQNFTK